MVNNKENLSIGELFSELSQETRTLLRQEVELAKVEMSRKASHVAQNVAFLALGGAVAYAGFLALIAAVILLIGTVIALWLSALVVGIVVTVIGYVLLYKGRENLRREDLLPRRTVESLKEDKEWLKNQVK